MASANRRYADLTSLRDALTESPRMDLLENGAFDLLVEPFATEDVRAVLQRVWTIVPERGSMATCG